MAERTTSRRGGFTLVEMLVVIAIIAILAAILIPVGNMALKTARKTTNAFEMAQIQQAIGTYASANNGLNPPSFGEQPEMGMTYAAVFNNGAGPWRNTRLGRYIQKAYPKATTRDIEYLFEQVADNADQTTALHFWLANTSDDPRYPFTGGTKRGNKYFAFDEQQLAAIGTIHSPGGNPPIPDLTLYAYRPPHAGESYYIYIEAGHYPLHVAADLSGNQATGRPPAGSGPPLSRTPNDSVRPWLRRDVNINGDTNYLNLNNYMNAETYQLFNAGLDGRYSANHDLLRKWPCGSTGLMFGGGAFAPADFTDDRDNQANFSDGAAVTDAAAQ
jgi:prepilin-type N-terminal cleavage/methylation domain-containing protein